MSNGKIAQIIGAVIDVEFPRSEVPRVYDALVVDESQLTLETQQQLGDGVVRTIAMGVSDGLKRGMAVSNTGAPIAVPVGGGSLGRIMNVLGDPIDHGGVDRHSPSDISSPVFGQGIPSRIHAMNRFAVIPVGRARSQFGFTRNDAQLLHAGQATFTHHVPADMIGVGVFCDVFVRGLNRKMRRLIGKVQKPRLIWSLPGLLEKA